jgi:hypothetical protein
MPKTVFFRSPLLGKKRENENENMGSSKSKAKKTKIEHAVLGAVEVQRRLEPIKAPVTAPIVITEDARLAWLAAANNGEIYVLVHDPDTQRPVLQNFKFEYPLNKPLHPIGQLTKVVDGGTETRPIATYTYTWPEPSTTGPLGPLRQIWDCTQLTATVKTRDAWARERKSTALPGLGPAFTLTYALGYTSQLPDAMDWTLLKKRIADALQRTITKIDGGVPRSRWQKWHSRLATDDQGRFETVEATTKAMVKYIRLLIRSAAGTA